MEEPRKSMKSSARIVGVPTRFETTTSRIQAKSVSSSPACPGIGDDYNGDGNGDDRMFWESSEGYTDTGECTDTDGYTERHWRIHRYWRIHREALADTQTDTDRYTDRY
jgi:hypothetical protein